MCLICRHYFEAIVKLGKEGARFRTVSEQLLGYVQPHKLI